MAGTWQLVAGLSRSIRSGSIFEMAALGKPFKVKVRVQTGLGARSRRRGKCTAQLTSTQTSGQRNATGLLCAVQTTNKQGQTWQERLGPQTRSCVCTCTRERTPAHACMQLQYEACFSP